ncbi:hypothetical protein LRS11_15455 [Pseudomonas sp. J452]|uniref:HD domain-containing protein n=1 Tax=Pseudomonas sp. J452 TaxID=2898441 RepID=UPI0021ADB861|nr:hypothetical protein [Pseudomonas sp. J452]UUY07219.1 hypothetical protein LRS11_15455 [Pseudomonas sp. J452]
MLSEDRWQTLWRKLGAAAPDGSFSELQQAYSEPHRHYHSSAHIAACLQHFDNWQHLGEQPLLIELALWSHDLIYDTRRQDNEAASAERAGQWLSQAGLPQHADTLRELILATRHQQPAETIDAALVVDIDLAILAAPASVYADYEQAVRREYVWVPEPLFRTGRSQLLRHLLAMPALYQHRELAEQWEGRARNNLQEALLALQQV